MYRLSMKRSLTLLTDLISVNFVISLLWILALAARCMRAASSAHSPCQTRQNEAARNLLRCLQHQQQLQVYSPLMLTIGEPDSVAEATGMFGQPAPLCLQPLQPPYTWAAAAHYDTPTKSRTRRAVLLLVDSLPFVSHDVLAFQNCKLQSSSLSTHNCCSLQFTCVSRC